MNAKNKTRGLGSSFFLLKLLLRPRPVRVLLVCLSILSFMLSFRACSMLAQKQATAIRGNPGNPGNPTTNAALLVLDSHQKVMDYYWHDLEPMFQRALSDRSLIARLIGASASTETEGEHSVTHFDTASLLQILIDEGLSLGYDEPVPVAAYLIRQHGAQSFGIELPLTEQVPVAVDPRMSNEFIVELVLALGPTSLWPCVSTVPIDGCETCVCIRTIHLHRVRWECSGFPDGQWWLEYQKGEVTTALRFMLRLGDVDGNGDVDVADMDAVRVHGSVLTDESNFIADVDCSGYFDTSDMIVVRNAMR